MQLRCTYCLPNGYKPSGRHEFLTLDEIRRVSTAFAELGIDARITGGEPTMAKISVKLLPPFMKMPD
ncbi:hypothetical protein MASR2M36_39080 [Providencia sp.]